MTRFLNSLVLVGFSVALASIVLDDFRLSAFSICVSGLAALVDYCRN
jgi:hypothetical protein